MLILIEGVDGVGKTTLIERLTGHLHKIRPNDTVEVWHKGPPTAHPLDEFVVPLLSYRPAARHHVICDRWHWSERVLSRFHGRETLLDDPMNTYIKMFLVSRGALGVHVVRDACEVQDAFRSRGAFVTPELDIARTQQLFADTEHRSALDTVTVRPDESGVEDYITAEAARTELRSRSLNAFTTYIGPPQVDTLFLGNARGPGRRNSSDPAFMPYPSTCGAALIRALHAAHLTDWTESVGIADAADTDSLPDLLRAVQPYCVVTLGEAAHEAYASVGGLHAVRSGAAPHPRFTTRQNRDLYSDALREAAQLGEDTRTWLV